MKKSAAVVMVILFMSGCAGLNGRVGKVGFEDPFTRLGIVTVPPNAEEQSGVELRLFPPAGNFKKTVEETTLYTRIHDGQGSEVKLNQTTKEFYRSGSFQDSYVVRTESTFQGYGGNSLEEFEVSRRGEILKLIQGKHDSKDGKFTITSWTRTPMFPMSPAKVGDTWDYEETMSLRLDSFWIKQTETSPYKIKAQCRLAGFAEVKGRRCAVIESVAYQIETQRFKVLFKNITLYIRAKIQETCYWDYKTGTEVARISKTQATTSSADSSVNDQSLSQTLSYPET